MDSASPFPLRETGGDRTSEAWGPRDDSFALDDPLVSAILCSLAAFGHGVSQLAAHVDSNVTVERKQSPSPYSAQAASAVGWFEDFCLASSLANTSLSRLQLPLLDEVAPVTVSSRPAGDTILDPPLHFPAADPLAFSGALGKLQELLLQLLAPATSHTVTESDVAPTPIRR